MLAECIQQHGERVTMRCYCKESMQDTAKLAKMLKEVVTSTSWKASAADSARLASLELASPVANKSQRHGSRDHQRHSPDSPWTLRAVHVSVSTPRTDRQGGSYSAQYARRRQQTPRSPLSHAVL